MKLPRPTQTQMRFLSFSSPSQELGSVISTPFLQPDTVNPLQMTLKVVNFQRFECASGSARTQNLCHQHQAWVKQQLALHLLLLATLPLYHLPPPLPPPASNPSCLFTRCQPLCACCFVHYCTSQGTVCKIKNISFVLCVCLFFMYHLCEEYYKPITVWYHLANCVRYHG